MYVLVNENIIDSKKFYTNINGQGLNYGYGLFETLKFVDEKIFFIDEHFRRFVKGCHELNMDLKYDIKEMKEYINKLILFTNTHSGALKILYVKNNDKYDLIIIIKENRYIEEMYEHGFKICLSSSKRNPESKLTYVKSNNYLENILEKDNALKQGYNEVVFLNTSNFISEGSYTNIFFVKGDKLYTPDISCGLLPGIMREKIIFLINKLSLKLKIGKFYIEDLMDADEVFLTNSLMEIMPVSKIKNKNFDLNSNKITKLLRKEFEKVYY